MIKKGLVFLRIRKKPWARPELDACEFCIKDSSEVIGKWNESFIKNQPIYLELGCGKGGFISQLASQRQDINFIAIDIKSEMMAYTRRKISAVFKEKEINSVNNVKLLVHNIETIEEVFNQDDVIDRIYINFCNPWPRSKHKKRRLTYFKKLIRYKDFLCDKGEIWFKTDDDGLFEESLEYFAQTDYDIKYITYDLHNSDFKENIKTEHEKMFSDMGIKIKFLIAVNKK